MLNNLSLRARLQIYFVTIIGMLIWLPQICAGASISYTFESHTSRVFSEGTPTVDITFTEDTSHVTVDSIPAPMSRASNGMLMLDFKNKVSIDKIDFDQSIYTVIMEIYLFEAEYTSTLFCLDINLTTTTATEASWCLSLYQSPGNLTMSSELLNSTHIFTNTIESAREFSGWQALQFSLEYIPEDLSPIPPVEAKTELSYINYKELEILLDFTKGS